MSALNTNQTSYNSQPTILTLLTDIPVSESEIADVVAFARQNQTYRFVAMVLGSEPIEAAIKRGLVVCTKGVLSVPVVEAPAVQAAENVEPTAECVVSDIETTDELAKQIETCSQSTDVAYRLHAQMLDDCLNGDWLDQQVAEIEREQEQAKLEASEQLHIPGMKLRNADRNDNYWIFTGLKLQAFEAVKWLANNGIFTSAKPNGGNGNYILCVPRWVRGLLIPC